MLNWKPTLSVAQSLAACASFVALLLVTAVPMLLGSTTFDPKMAFDWMTFVAVVWATAFAADNLAEMQRTRISEFEPLLDVEIDERRARGEPLLWVAVRNFGKGVAAGLVVTLYQLDPDEVEWIPKRLDIPETLKSGDSGEAAVNLNLLRFLLDKESATDLIVRLDYRDPFGREQTEERSFAMVPGEYPARFQRISAPPERALGGKQQKLQEALDELTTTLQLREKGIIITGSVNGDGMDATISDGFGEVWRTHMSTNRPVALIVEAVEDRLKRPLRDAPPSDDIADGTSVERIHTDV